MSFTKIRSRLTLISVRQFLVFSLLASLSPSLATANNCYFFPGDAFFYTELDQAEWEAFKDGKLNTLDYDRPKHLSTAFCGYLGFRRFDVAKLPDDYRKRLIEAGEKMKNAYPTKMVIEESPSFFGAPPEQNKVEINKLRIFIYNRSFDVTRRRIGLKYNESWPDAGIALGHNNLEHLRYEFFVSTPAAIVESWRLGSEVAGLDAAFPTGRGIIDDPISFDITKHQILIAPPVEFGELAFPGRDSKLECYVVDKQSITTLSVDPKTKRWKRK